MELDVFDANNNRIRHTLYYMVLQEGTSTHTTSIADSVYVNYKGQLLNLTVFDDTTTQSASNWMDLLGNIVTNRPSGTIREFKKEIAQLKPSITKPTENFRKS